MLWSRNSKLSLLSLSNTLGSSLLSGPRWRCSSVPVVTPIVMLMFMGLPTPPQATCVQQSLFTIKHEVAEHIRALPQRVQGRRAKMMDGQEPIIT